MKECVRHGFEAEGVLPGVLKVPRRAPRLYRELCGDGAAGDFMDWVNAYALAVNEENAAGGRIVTAPTNGAAGIIPGRAALLQALRQQRGRGGHHPLPADRWRDRDPLQEERLDLRRGDGLPGRGRRGLLDGRRRPGRGDGRQQRAGGERRRDRHGAQPRA
jgi:hypothetical protein